MTTKNKTDQVRNNPNREVLTKLLIDAYSKKGKRRSLKSILLEAGYSPASASNPHIILSQPTISAEIGDFVEKLRKKRDRVAELAFTESKLEKLDAPKGAYVLDILTKNVQLLSGKATDRVGINLEDDEREEIDAIFKKNKK